MGQKHRFNKYLELNDINSLKELCKEKGVLQKYKKGDFLVRKGSLTNVFGFVKSGAVKYLSYSSKGEEKVVGFSFSDDFIADLDSFLQYYSLYSTKILALTDVQVIMDCEIYVVTYNDISLLENTLIKDIIRIFFVDMYTRLLSMYCDTAEERYLKLVKRHPDILNIAALKDLASFINVTPETLSRIRRKIISSQS